MTFSLANKTATIKTKQTSYCTLYFATGEPALEHLKATGGSTFAGGGGHTTAVDGMYRFKGTASQVLNNYICFGTTVESTCTGTPATYMYRIIGITSAADNTIGLSANQLKIIRAVPSSTSQTWSRNPQKWDASDVKSYLNTTFINTITKGVDGTYWDSLISQHGWYIKDQSSIGTTEPKDTPLAGDKSNRIGLMYATDYKNSGDQNKNNWLFIKNGWESNGDMQEWTMSRSGCSDASSCQAWYIYVEDGTLINWFNIAVSWPVRPVFYLRPGVNLTGEGTKDHPYIITSLPNN